MAAINRKAIVTPAVFTKYISVGVMNLLYLLGFSLSYIPIYLGLGVFVAHAVIVGVMFAGAVHLDFSVTGSSTVIINCLPMLIAGKVPSEMRLRMYCPLYPVNLASWVTLYVPLGIVISFIVLCF